ncbi:TPA: SelT/SelW/SelH family protein [Vibrio cholerae]|nr:SelT/SelW/SelH family protein [Vibrio cholerae]
MGILLLSLLLSSWLYWGSDFKLEQVLTSREWQSKMVSLIKTNSNRPAMGPLSRVDVTMNKAQIEIYYCRQCNWMLRSAWLSQELLHTFSEEIEYVALHPDTGGRFEIFCNGVQIWERKQEGGFPEAKVLKQRVRDLIDPERDLGHVDRPSSTQS